MVFNNIINQKQKITLTIDFDVYLKIKTSGINMSALVNDYLTEYFKDDSPLRRSDEIEEDLIKKETEIIKLKTQIAKARFEEEKHFNKRLEKAKAWNQAKRDSRVMDFE